MLRRSILLNGTNDENVDSGAETAESDCSKMSSPKSEVQPWRVPEPPLMSMHLLANPGDSLLLQHTLDRLLRWLCPSLHVFHVSERACPLRDHARAHLCPAAGYPSAAVTIFLHEAYGEERILRVLDFLQRPPWQYHHTESCGGRAGGIHITSSTSPANALLRPYLLPSRDFYSLGTGMPVWGVRPVHYGGEMLRVTLYSGYDNFEDAVRLYETVLQRQAEEQKTGFCWFTLHTEPGLCLQLALKQLSPGVRVESCSSAVLQFRVEEIGQLVPLLPNPCTPISATRWQTEDLDGNKILFQVKAPARSQQTLTCAFPLAGPNGSPRGPQRSPGSPAVPTHTQLPCSQPAPSTRPECRPRTDPGLERLSRVPQGGGGSLGSDSCCSTPPGSSCYSSQRSSPALLATNTHNSPARPSLSHLLLEEEPETNVDTGIPVPPQSEADNASDTRISVGLRSARPAAVGASALETLAGELSDCCLESPPSGTPRTRGTPGCQAGTPGYQAGTPARNTSGSRTPGQSPPRGSVERTTADTPAKTLLPPTHNLEPLDEFFI